MHYIYTADVLKGMCCVWLGQEGDVKYSIYETKHVKDHGSDSGKV